MNATNNAAPRRGRGLGRATKIMLSRRLALEAALIGRAGPGLLDRLAAVAQDAGAEQRVRIDAAWLIGAMLAAGTVAPEPTVSDLM